MDLAWKELGNNCANHRQAVMGRDCWSRRTPDPQVLAGPVVPSATRVTVCTTGSIFSWAWPCCSENSAVPNPLWASHQTPPVSPVQRDKGCLATLLGELSCPAAGRETEPPQCLLAFRYHSMAGNWPAPDPCRQRHPLHTRKG